MIGLLEKLFKKQPREEYVEVRNQNYKTCDQLTKDDYWLMDADRANTGIEHYSDEYYYNHILFYNFDRVKKTA